MQIKSWAHFFSYPVDFLFNFCSFFGLNFFFHFLIFFFGLPFGATAICFLFFIFGKWICYLFVTGKFGPPLKNHLHSSKCCWDVKKKLDFIQRIILILMLILRYNLIWTKILIANIFRCVGIVYGGFGNLLLALRFYEISSAISIY